MEKRKRGGQPGNQNARGHGAPFGNRNAVGHGAPAGNRNAEKHGLYSRYILPTPLDYMIADAIIAKGEKLTLDNFLSVKNSLLRYIYTGTG